MQSNAKAIRLLEDIKDLLAVRLAGSATIDTIRTAFDANNWPYLVLSDGGVETAGSAVILIRISNVDAVSKDIFGNQTYAYAPHVLEFAYELTAADNAIPTNKDILTCEFEAIKSGVRFQLKELANGTAVTAANVTSAAVSADLDQLYWPTKLV